MKKYLWKLILPIAFQQFMLALVSASDAFMLGRLNQEALSAVSLAGQTAFVFQLFMAAFTIGTNMFAAQYWGSQDRQAVKDVMSFVLRTTFLTAFVFFAAAAAAPSVLMRIFTNDRTLTALGTEYLRAAAASYILSGISQVYLCIMKNTGRAGMSMVISSVTVILNIILNAVLIFGHLGMPALGVAGAAYATVIANMIGLIWAVLESFRAEGIRPAKIRRAGHGKMFVISDLEKRFWRYVWPVLLNEIVWGGGFTMYSVIMGHLGRDAVAANSIANIAKNLVICFCLGLGSAGSIMIGNELGAGAFERAKSDGAYLCRMSAAGGILSGMILLALSPVILHSVHLSVQAEEYLKWMLLISAYYLVGKSINSMTIGGIFCAGGDAGFGLCCDAVTLWCITIPLGAAAAFIFKAPVMAVYFLLNLDEIIKLPAVYRHYKKYRWMKNLVTVQPTAEV